MKTIGRIFIILTVFSILVGLMVTTVNFVGNAVGNDAPASQSRPGEDGGENRSEHGERGGNATGLMYGAIKNSVVIGFLVTMIVWPKSVAKKKKKSVAMIPANGKS